MVSRFANLRRCAMLGVSLGLLVVAPLAHAGCEDLLPADGAAPTGPRRLTTDDLLRLRDIGMPDASAFFQSSPLGLSPDGKELAFVLNRADPVSNSYCRALVVVNLSGPREARALDRGGDLITLIASQRGMLWDFGGPAPVTPAWSPDGRWIAYLRRDHGVTQLWRVGSDGQGAHAVTQSPVDVERFVWSADGRRLIYGSTPAVIEAQKAIDREGLTGWLNDERIVPNFGPRPLISGALQQQVFAIELETERQTTASNVDKSAFAAGEETSPRALSGDGRRAWTEHVSQNPLSPQRLVVEDAGGKRIACIAQDCTGSIYKLWWDPDGKSLIVLRREGWNKGQMSLLRWTPGETSFHRILLTDDVLEGCVPGQTFLICTSENSTTPRHVTRINLATGRQHVVFDPNPEFRNIRLGSVTRLTWRNDLGLPAWGDLVLPPDYQPGTKLPLIITQYHSDGFLRGSTGDEYPIFAFAARGYAVLSLERTPFYGSDNPDLHSMADLSAAGIKDWNERRNLLSSLVVGVRTVLDRGVVDPARIGITGLSDGASTTRFALVNTRLFAAAAISTCCVDTNAMMNAGGIGMADVMKAHGYPATIAHDEAFWAPYSMALSATRMDRPLLMQLADSEMGLGLETFTALREAGQPVEMYVYPGEHHNKWQPAHRQAIYQRNLDWFDFWLRGKVDPDPAKAEQYKRWEVMKAKRKPSVSTG